MNNETDERLEKLTARLKVSKSEVVKIALKMLEEKLEKGEKIQIN
jgi:hypothetical protein